MAAMLAVLNYLQRALGLAYIGSILVAVLMTMASVAGLVDDKMNRNGSGVRGGGLR